MIDAERVGDDTRAGLEVGELVAELQQIVGQQEERQHRGLLELGRVHVALLERRLVADAGLRRVAPGELDHVRVELDAERARAAPGRGNDVAPITGSEIDDEVLRRDLGHVEHLLYR